MSHLYACAATTSKRLASIGSQPTRLRCVDDRHRVVLDGRSCDGVEIRDLARRHLHGTERDNVHVRPDLPRQLGCGDQRVRTPRCSCTRNGKSSDVNSTSGASTREPSGIEAATSPTSVDTFGPMATLSTGAPTSRAKDARASSPGIPQCSQLVRPPCQSSSALWSASHAGRGGRPYDAVLRYVAEGLHNSCASATFIRGSLTRRS